MTIIKYSIWCRSKCFDELKFREITEGVSMPSHSIERGQIRRRMDGTIPQKEEDMYYYGMWIDPVYVHIKVPSHSIEREEMRSLMDGTIPQKEEDIYEHGTCIDPVYIHIKAPPTPYKTIGEQVYDEYMQEQIAGVEYIRSCEFLMNSFERASKKITEIMGKTLFIYPDKEDTYHFGDYECSAELICEMGKNNLGLSIERYKSPDEENGE